MLLRQLFDEETHTYTYLLADPKSRKALLIDTVLGQTDRDLQLLAELDLSLAYVLDTHVHADHVTGAGVLRERTGAKIVASPHGAECIDMPVSDGDLLKMGDVEVRVIETPGHTDDSLSYLVDGNVFTGDALLIRGCGRTDFQNGNARELYESIAERLFALPEKTAVWPAHDYHGHTQSTIGEEKTRNPRVAGKSREEFVELMESLRLPRPKYLDIAVPANRECGLGLSVSDVGDQGGFQDLAAPEALAFAKRSKAIIFDVREPHEFAGPLGHIEGAISLPHGSVPEASLDLSFDQPLVVVCRSGRRSRGVCQALAKRGFRNVVNLRGGMLEYREEQGS